MLGNLTFRGDTLKSQSEYFQYDTLNRVVRVETATTGGIPGGTPQTGVVTTGYDAKGNITNRSDVGAYSYGGGSAACSALADARPLAGLHAVSGIASAFAGGKNAAYCYDQNGNLLAGDGRTVTWTAYDMVASVTRGARAVSFDYGPDRSRFKRVDITPAGITTTVYAGGGATEVITRPGGGSEMKTYIGDFAVVTTPTTPAGAASVTQYLHRDHLGSVDTITNASGQVVQRMSFDSWGKRREVSWLTMTDGAIAAFDTTATTTRGFTGHEMIDPVGLVHMNGRVYDPEIGRFLSADPFVQETGNLQSWNRYSYVLNNPLSFTDPSGFFFSKLFKSIGKALGSAFRAIGAAVKKILQNPIFRAIINIVGCALPGVGQLACAAITGALTAAAGGSLADSLKAAAFAFVSMGAFKFVGGFTNALSGVGGAILKAGIHGVVGGALSVAQGGSFLQGFAGSAAGALGGYVAGESGFVGQYGDGDSGNILARALISGAAGCAGAVISGGKCAEAAVTAAFASLYNGETIAETRRRQIAETAKSYDGSEDWAQSASKGAHGPGSDKCNLFVYDVLRDVGISAPSRGWPTSGGPISAGSWANPLNNIEGWVIVDNPQPGDIGASTSRAGIAANKTGVFRGASGHVAVVTGSGLATGTTSTGSIGELPFRRVFVHEVTTFRRYYGR